jgi:hypothetical protein
MNPVQWAWVTDNTTFVSPLGLGVTLALALALLMLPRKHALVPVLLLTCYMTMGQRVMVVGLNFTMIRILILFGWVRLILRGELRRIQLHNIDYVLASWAIIGVIAHTLLYMNSDAMVYRLGQAYNAVGTYFLFRYMIRSWEDIDHALKMLATFVVPLAAMMIVEKFTGRNVFAGFGGVPAISEVREGVIRCQGPFGHSILAGTFGASLIPLFMAMTRQGKGFNPLPWLGLTAATIIAVTGGSSGPIIACAFGVLGFCFWPIRKSMRVVRWSILASLVGLQMIMKAPIWFLIARVSVFNGSTGYHRSYLINQAIMNFSEWWLFGTKSTAHWGYEMIDLTNQYIRQGVEGGFLTMALFIAIIVLAFRDVGVGVRKQPIRGIRFQVWAMGCALIVHVFSFISVSYFDQNFVNWYMLLAIIATVASLRQTASIPELRPVLVQKQETRSMALAPQLFG